MILVNGNQTDFVNALDRGLQYGDGLFETIAVRDGKPLLWDRHIERLMSGCARLNIPAIDLQVLAQEANSLCDGHSGREVLKIIITRGVGGRGYRSLQGAGQSTHNEPTRILSLHPWPEYPHIFSTEGIKLRLCQTRLGINPVLAGIKHLNRLEQVLARNEWNDPETPEGLMLDHLGNVIEGTISNVFIVKKGTLMTPDLSGSGVDGVMRGVILDSAQSLAIPTEITALGLDAVIAADEIFLCNTLINLWPVRHFEGREYAVGRLTQDISKELKKYLHS